MNIKLKTSLMLFAISFCIMGCFSPNYKKIPLQASEIPYILADGDYKDNKGNIHKDQHNVWAMSQSDVFNYMKWVKSTAPKSGSSKFGGKLDWLFTKANGIMALSIVSVVLLIILIIKSTKRRKEKQED